LPFAGGGASVYRKWPDDIPNYIEMAAVQLPGRESRLKEPRLTNMADIVHEVANAINPFLEQPYVLFGYSFGALIAFELARELRRRKKPLPTNLLVAAMHAPHTQAAHSPFAHLPEQEFLEHIDKYYQPSDEAWKIPELRDLILPILRDDIRVGEDYEYLHEQPLSCPIDVYVGTNDKSTPVSSAKEWQTQTTADYNLTEFPGSHFFIQESLTELQKKIYNRILGSP